MINSIEKKIVELSMVMDLNSNFFHYIKDANSTHFIQKIIVCFDEKYITNIFNEVATNIVAFGNHACGLCVVKKWIYFLKKYIFMYCQLAQMFDEQT